MDLEFGANLRGKLFTALTGNSEADVTGKGDVRGMLMAVGGSSSKTKSGIDLTKAAAKLGVSRRTVERWVKTAATGQGQRPSPACQAFGRTCAKSSHHQGWAQG